MLFNEQQKIDSERYFDKKELATIMGTLIDAIISRKCEVENKEYCCEEELKSLETQIDVLNKLANKVSKIINS